VNKLGYIKKLTQPEVRSRSNFIWADLYRQSQYNGENYIAVSWFGKELLQKNHTWPSGHRSSPCRGQRTERWHRALHLAQEWWFRWIL